MKNLTRIKYIALLAILLISMLPLGIAGAKSAQPSITGEPVVDTLDYTLERAKVKVRNYAPDTTYGCTLVNQNPVDYVVMRPRQTFDMNWVVVNTGKAVWHTGTTVYSFYSGVPMYTKEEAYQLPADVGIGGKLKMTIDMEAPKNPGTYSTTWAILTGNTRVCRMFLIITVK